MEDTKELKVVSANDISENSESKNVFAELMAVNVNGHTEQKKTGTTTLTYLSWTFAYAEIMKRYPDMRYEIKHWNGRPYMFDENLGYMVETSVTVNGETKTMWLPVMDGQNRAMKNAPYEIQTKYKTITVQAASMMDINKTIMRCLVKNLSMFGLGLYIYAGEDLPISEEDEPKKIEKNTTVEGTCAEVDREPPKPTVQDAASWWDRISERAKAQWRSHYKVEAPTERDIYSWYCRALEQNQRRAR